MQLFEGDSAKYLAKKLTLFKQKLSINKDISEVTTNMREKYVERAKQKLLRICTLISSIENKIAKIESKRVDRLSEIQSSYVKTLEEIEKESENTNKRSMSFSSHS